MAFRFAIRKLNKVLENEKTLAAIGADRFAPGRVKELKDAIEILESAHQQVKLEKKIERQVIRRHKMKLTALINQIPLFK